MHALVTGATGFIGTNLVQELLRRNYSVSCPVRSMARAGHLRQNRNIQLFEEDLCAPRYIGEHIRKSDIVFHLAGTTKAIRKSDYFRGNLETTRQLSTMISRHAPKHQKTVYISSQAAGGPSASEPGVDEETAESLPVSTYGRSKRCAEENILSLGKEFPVVILRPCIVFGPHDQGMKLLFQAASKGLLIKSGFRRFPVNLIYVEDLVDAIIMAGESDRANGQLFYVTDGVAYSWDTLLCTMANHTNPGAFTITVPLAVLWLLCQIGAPLGFLTGKAQDLNPDKWHEIKQHGWLCSSKHIEEELGFQARWTLDRAIKTTSAWYLTKKNAWKHAK